MCWYKAAPLLQKPGSTSHETSGEQFQIQSLYEVNVLEVQKFSHLVNMTKDYQIYTIHPNKDISFNVGILTQITNLVKIPQS